MKVVRVFPRRTRATPDDADAYVGLPHLYTEADEVHISVTFTYDLPAAEKLEKEWSRVAPVKIGGPATGQASGDFEPGLYLKPGYVITSRGCPNRCWFCDVPRREGAIRELPIRDGWNVLDDNLLACSDAHIQGVFAMLAKQGHPVQFTGGLEAARLKDWQVAELRALHPKQIFFAYDTPSDRDPLFDAGKRLLAAGFTRTSRVLRAYVLVGYRGDMFSAAETRLRDCLNAGFFPMAMLYRDRSGKRDPAWVHFQKLWARPASIAAIERAATT